MLPKFFFENYFQGELKNEIFVSMPFDNSFDDKFKIIEYVGENLCGFDDLKRTKENEWSGNEITNKIFDYIAHSKMLLFDLSDDPKYNNNELNYNVVYELGVATTFRDPSDILLIRKNNPNKIIENLPFDIKCLQVNEYKNGLNINWLKEIISEFQKGQVYYKNSILASVFNSLDDIGIFIINKYKNISNFVNPVGNFHIQQIFDEISFANPKLKTSIIEVRSSVIRLLEIGILKIEPAPKESGFEFSYYFTFFGKNILEYMKKRDEIYYR